MVLSLSPSMRAGAVCIDSRLAQTLLLKTPAILEGGAQGWQGVFAELEEQTAGVEERESGGAAGSYPGIRVAETSA